ncbi:MAG: glycosyltransferase family 4 protein [Synergistales bacterium]
MRCLYLTPFNPFPARSGGALLTDRMLRRIGEAGPVDVATFGDSTDYSSYKGVEHVFSLAKNPLYRVRALFGEYPESLERHTASNIREAFSAEEYTHILCDSFTPVLNLARLPGLLGEGSPVRTVLLSHNLESQVERENTRYDAGRFSWHKRKILERDVKRMERAEASLLPLFDHILSVSEHESRIMAERYGCGNLRTLPLSFAHRTTWSPEGRKPGTILFAGSMWWLPNRHGLAWFFENCWETILAACPEARLVLAGNDKTGFAREMAGRYRNVMATGYVEDIEPYFRQASVFVLPLRIGTGIKIKLLEAMGWGIPVVSTPKGIEGAFGFVEGRHALVCDSPEDFSSGMIRVLGDPALRERMGREGLALTESNRRAFESLLEEVFSDG